MIHPILVNIKSFNNDGTSDIGTGIIDMHESQIHRILAQPDGTTGIRTTDGYIVVMIPFLDFITVYEEFNDDIDKRYQEEVLSYYKDNYQNLKGGE
jgi:hypothetical protein